MELSMIMEQTPQLFAPMEQMLADTIDLFVDSTVLISDEENTLNVILNHDPDSKEVHELQAKYSVTYDDIKMSTPFKKPWPFVIYLGISDMMLTAVGYLFYHFLNDGYHDLFFMLAHMAIYPQNIFFWLLTLAYKGLDQDLTNRRAFYRSTNISKWGPWNLYSVYILWAIVDSLA